MARPGVDVHIPTGGRPGERPKAREPKGSFHLDVRKREKIFMFIYRYRLLSAARKQGCFGRQKNNLRDSEFCLWSDKGSCSLPAIFRFCDYCISQRRRKLEKRQAKKCVVVPRKKGTSSSLQLFFRIWSPLS